MIKPLTSLRFFAALAVVYDHLGTGSHTGGLGVIFFFLLSGFIITYTYSSKSKELSVASLANIYVSRAGRIFPMHIFTLVLAIPLVLYSGTFPEFGIFTTNALLMHSWYPSSLDYFSFNSVSWTLSIEWAFYLSFPFILHAARYYKIEASTTKIFALYATPLAIITVISTMYYYRIEQFNYYWWLLKISPLNTLIFISGSSIGFLYLKSNTKSPTYAMASIMEITSILIISALYCVIVKLGLGKSLPFDYTLLFIPAFSLCIYVFSFSSGLISKVFSVGILVKLGELSFSIYMLHLLIIRYADIFIMPVSGSDSSLASHLLIIATSIAASYAIYTAIESPCRNIAKKIGKYISSRLDEHAPGTDKGMA